MSALAGASGVVLSYLFPRQQQAFEDLVTTQRDASSGQSQRAFARSEAIGRTEGILTVRRSMDSPNDCSCSGADPLIARYNVASATDAPRRAGCLAGGPQLLLDVVKPATSAVQTL
jgi:hypothetical protein